MTTVTAITAHTHQQDLMRRGALRTVRGTGRPSLLQRLASGRRPVGHTSDHAGSTPRALAA